MVQFSLVASGKILVRRDGAASDLVIRVWVVGFRDEDFGCSV